MCASLGGGSLTTTHLALYAEREDPNRRSDTRQTRDVASAAAKVHARALATRDENDDWNRSPAEEGLPGSREPSSPRSMLAPAMPTCVRRRSNDQKRASIGMNGRGFVEVNPQERRTKNAKFFVSEGRRSLSSFGTQSERTRVYAQENRVSSARESKIKTG